MYLYHYIILHYIILHYIILFISFKIKDFGNVSIFEEHKSNFRRNGYYHNVLLKHKKENVDNDFDCANVEILHCESNKCKREFMDMLYIKKRKFYQFKN